MRRPGRDGWSSAPSIEMVDAADGDDEGADDDDHDRQARLRAMAAALGVLHAVPRDM